ncbi:MAG: hypothetical protein II312_00315 [Lachnospiraceae bacterium]|nr:hypothetical protein [Lachnospiraceae bacterium]MBQ2405116.1 hypothetical protein [Lachnospiraceae bacterium]
MKLLKNRNNIITIAFLIFILTIPAVSVIRNVLPEKDRELTEAERNVLENSGSLNENSQEGADTEESVQADVPAPEITPQPFTFAVLQGKINDFTNGLFGRTKLIAFNTGLTSFLTGGTYIESTQSLMGKNNMFFYKTELDGHPIWDYMGINHFTDDELAAIKNNLEATKKHLNDRGIEFYTMCIPNKEIVYPENMPDTIARVNEVSRGQQLDEYLEANSDVTYVYPLKELLAGKEKDQIYYITDSHCNQKGSFIAMQTFFKEVYGTYADLDSVTFEVHATDHSGDLAFMAGLADKYKIDTVYVFDKESADKEQYKDQVLLYLGDSFGGFLSTICKGYYKEVHWYHPNDFYYGMLDEYNPDIVIWERAERYCETFAEPILDK